MVFATIKGVGSTPHTAARAYDKAWERFRLTARREGWIIVGARHLARAKGDAWIDHAHVVVAVSQGDHARLASAVRAAGAWVDRKPIESIERTLRYALRGAMRPPAAEHTADWIAATVGRRPVIVSRPSTYKRKISPVTNSSATPSATPATQARARVVALLSGSPPMAASALRRRLTPGHRGHLDAILATMAASGEIVPVRGRRGVRWALAEREAA